MGRNLGIGKILLNNYAVCYDDNFFNLLNCRALPNFQDRSSHRDVIITGDGFCFSTVVLCNSVTRHPTGQMELCESVGVTGKTKLRSSRAGALVTASSFLYSAVLINKAQKGLASTQCSPASFSCVQLKYQH